ncbi:MAG: hypothetical protein HQ583_04050 [Candidatus Abyssubacteria bacterium]|nr:hypothetical protein [Candidatus Abyssubacteria bacterium]
MEEVIKRKRQLMNAEQRHSGDKRRNAKPAFADTRALLTNDLFNCVFLDLRHKCALHRNNGKCIRAQKIQEKRFAPVDVHTHFLQREKEYEAQGQVSFHVSYLNTRVVTTDKKSDYPAAEVINHIKEQYSQQQYNRQADIPEMVPAQIDLEKLKRKTADRSIK